MSDRTNAYLNLLEAHKRIRKFDKPFTDLLTVGPDGLVSPVSEQNQGQLRCPWCLLDYDFSTITYVEAIWASRGVKTWCINENGQLQGNGYYGDHQSGFDDGEAGSEHLLCTECARTFKLSSGRDIEWS
jgi:hypothetical protein